MKLEDIKQINEEYWNGDYYCVVTLENGKQYYKTSKISMKDNNDSIIDIMRTGNKWYQFIEILSRIKVS